LQWKKSFVSKIRLAAPSLGKMLFASPVLTLRERLFVLREPANLLAFLLQKVRETHLLSKSADSRIVLSLKH